jgi:hypothetical protein
MTTSTRHQGKLLLSSKENDKKAFYVLFVLFYFISPFFVVDAAAGA